MCEREEPCQSCGGDGGFDVPHDIDRVNGGMITHWVRCEPCGGTGHQSTTMVPVTLADIERIAAEMVTDARNFGIGFCRIDENGAHRVDPRDIYL
jgi:hypothetical protein